MVDVEERELLLQSLKGYLESLRESGLDELDLAPLPALDHDCQAAGNPLARLLFVMSGTGFAGAAGDLLAKIIQAMGFATSQVCLLSFAALPATPDSLRQTLLERIAAVGPEVIVTLGEQAAQLLLQSGETVEKLRGSFQELAGIPLLPTLHPEAMLENPSLKREVWSDMQQVMRRLAPAV